ncbi:rod shape-determining protein MreD [Winogradskyella sp. A3E31]|uniref:rod shape-determining protein MreD n=1 Tax=Winogradskyella sp. A3E31 TaxID=3349637 RepID=UPI00398A6AB2
MNSKVTNNVIRFILLVLAQVLICNNINFMGYINPYIYILFILLFPVKDSRLQVIFLSFLIGTTIDMFSDSGGVHAAASVVIAYARPLFLKFSFGTLYEYQTIKFSHTDLGNLTIYVATMTLLHHLVLFSLEIFNISNILQILQQTLFSGIFTLIICVLLIVLFGRRK